MVKNNFLIFVILCVTLSQGFAFPSDNPAEDSSDHVVRKKRVIDRTPNANTRVQLRDAFYVVNVKKNDVHACAGSILAASIILTVAKCFLEHARYTVVSGTLSTISGGMNHRVTGLLRHPQYVPLLLPHNIALLSIEPPIAIGEIINRPIAIFHSTTGQLPNNTTVTVSGFGDTYQTRRGGIGCISSGRGEHILFYKFHSVTTSSWRLANPNELRSIRLPTVCVRDCIDLNPNNPFINNDIVCTSHPQKSCSSGEIGNPLVYNGYLVGALVVDGFNQPTDLYVNLARPDHRNWILEHMSPAHIPAYIPPPQHHRRPQACSQIHPC